MGCRDEILSDDYIDYIWKVDARTALREAERLGICGQYVTDGLMIFYMNQEEVVRNPSGMLIGDYAVTYCHTQLDTESLEKTRILTIQNQPALGLRGRGVLLGFLDSGIALEDAVFRNLDGSTRVVGLWDQTDQSGEPPGDMRYGTAYTAEDIDHLLQEGTENLPGYDENGHGTKVASIAAGSALEDRNFIGAAPEASIAFVKLKPAKPYIRRLQQIPQDAVAYEEADMMLAVRYLDMLASELGMPLVICLALGSNSGGHTGATPLGLYLSEFARRAGRAVAAAAGNEGNQGHHFYGEIPPDTGYLDVELRVGANESGFQMNLWGNAPGIFSVEVISPSGEKIPRIFSRPLERQRYEFVFENTVLDLQYEQAEVISGDERLLLLFRDPTPGIWRIRVFARGDLDSSFHIWLPITGFISDDTYFLRSSRDTTVTEPANAEGVITFAGYDARENSIWLDSSRGLTRYQRQKPDLAAPAVEVSAIDRRGNAGTLTGTSAAAALGAGACALFLEWGIVRDNFSTMDSVTIQRYLIRGAARPPVFTYPNQLWGYGLLDLYGGFQAVSGSRASAL